ncbi:PREDICTED: protein WVD2-like 7 isoform X2 [Lupinus angustifolius]|uniref:protein WVD2-like 7 isoform X2 n=1 Tax=Lupinus angustifolius TaxID=3871 RepID=UPI00092F7D30|nr:PREDICTED: protein WVD2-like 7 isoform X2 [Lupinus angustifolius]
MAGEVEESFSINFQADSIHSGSISFGRFENEPLCWERRSSFSHNRYLEEVEKCSKPGSVTEKKAYFEAHFKKKGLRGIIPSAGHDRSDISTSENDGSERIGNQDDFESNDGYVQFDQGSKEEYEPNEDRHYVPIEKRFEDGFEQNVDDHYVQFEQRFQEGFVQDESDYYVEQRSQEEFEPNDGYYVQFGDIPVSSDSDYHGDYGVIGYAREDAISECTMLSFSSPLTESSMNISNGLEKVTSKTITLDEAHNFENERGKLLSTNDEVVTEVKKVDNDNENTDETSRNMSMTENESAPDAEKAILHDNSYPSPKTEPGLNSEVNNAGVLKSTSSRSPKNPERRTNMEKSLPKLAVPTTCSSRRNAKEVSRSAKKLIRESKSEKVLRVKKAAESQPSVLKTDSKGVQESERLYRAFDSTKADVRPRAASFNFKCSERAERRKEFYLKLEEKMHAKEAEINQMQAISQEKKEAEIKKLRKSLNFKATPMPSFYRATLPSQSHGAKAASNSTRSKSVQYKPKCPRSEAEAASSSKLKMGNDQSADVSIHEITETNASEASLMISPAPSTNRSCHSNHASENKERAKVTSQKHRASESSEGAKRQSSQGNKNSETTKQSDQTMRKGVRNVGLRNSSRSGNVAVRVAS